jgi:hypothetical protein
LSLKLGCRTLTSKAGDASQEVTSSDADGPSTGHKLTKKRGETIKVAGKKQKGLLTPVSAYDEEDEEPETSSGGDSLVTCKHVARGRDPSIVTCLLCITAEKRPPNKRTKVGTAGNPAMEVDKGSGNDGLFDMSSEDVEMAKAVEDHLANQGI